MEVVSNIVSNCKEKYRDRFKYYLTGSYARNESGFKDYDIAIYDNENDNKDWESLLSMFFNVKESDGTYRALGEEERQAGLKKSEELVKKACSY